MNDFECKKVNNCFGGTEIYEYRVSFKFGDEFLAYLGKAAEVKCRRNFPRPFFTAIWPDSTKVQGVLGDVTLKGTYPAGHPEVSKLEFEIFLGKFANNTDVSERVDS